MRKLKIFLFDQETTNFFRETILGTMKVREQQGIVRHDMINLLMQAKKGNLNYEKETEKIAEGFATVKESHVGKNKVLRKWDDEDLVAQCLVFYLAGLYNKIFIINRNQNYLFPKGFESVSRMMSFVTYELMANPDVQRKLQDEIYELNEHLDGEKLNYEHIQSLKYLDQVVSETLRLWPSSKIDRFVFYPSNSTNIINYVFMLIIDSIIPF